MLKIAVCDDEKYCGEKIVSLLEESLDKYGISVYGIDTYLSGREFVEKNDKSYEYDVIFWKWLKKLGRFVLIFYWFSSQHLLILH